MRVMVIGVGRMGQNHIRAARTLGLDVVACVDREMSNLKTAQTELGLAEDILFTDLAKAHKDTNPDTVMIATTAPAHADLTIVMAEQGVKNILCEKPMAQSLKQCDEMIAACEKSGVRLAINHQMRFMDQYTIVKNLLDSPKFGGLSSMNVTAGCFGLCMNGIHYIEAFRYLSGSNPKSVQAWFSRDDLPNPRGPEFKDKAGSIRITAENGKRFYLEASNDHGHGMTVNYAAPYGHIFVDELAGEMILTYREEEHREAPMTRYGMPNIRETIQFPVADNVGPTAAVLKALIDGRNYPTGQEARQALASLVAAYQSNNNDHANIALTDELPLREKFPWA